MSAASRTPPPSCPSCSDPEPAWEIASPVRAIDRLRFDAAGLTELGLFPPEEGIEPLGRPVISCVACGTLASAEIGEAVLKAVIATGQPLRPARDA
jgi:hypothetical protein